MRAIRLRTALLRLLPPAHSRDVTERMTHTNLFPNTTRVSPSTLTPPAGSRVILATTPCTKGHLAHVDVPQSKGCRSPLDKELPVDGALPRFLSDRVPMEVCESIVDEMDYCDLPIAALVSRAWYARSTHNLYYVVHIKSRKSFNSLVEQSRRSPRVKQMLTTTHQLLVAHEDRRSQQKPFLDALPLVFSNALPLLEILTINAALRPSMHPTFFLALSHFERLVTLELYRVELCNITELRRIVRAFPRLEELGLDSVTMMQAYPPNNGSPHLARPSSCLQSSIKLQRLQIGVSPQPGCVRALLSLVNWLVDSESCASLRDLTMNSTLCLTSDEEYQTVFNQTDRLVKTSGRFLTCFRAVHPIPRPPFFPWRGSSGSHNLLANVALREVTLALYAINDPEDPQDGWQSMADKLRVTLSTVRSHRLEHITVNFWVDLILPDHYLRKGWLERTQKQFTADMHSLHEVMARPYFDALKSVDVRIDAKYVLRRLPLSSEQRIRETARELVVPSFRNWFAPWHHRGGKYSSAEAVPISEIRHLRYTRAVLVYMIGGHVQYEATYLKESTFLSHKHGTCPLSLRKQRWKSLTFIRLANYTYMYQLCSAHPALVQVLPNPSMFSMHLAEYKSQTPTVIVCLKGLCLRDLTALLALVNTQGELCNCIPRAMSSFFARIDGPQRWVHTYMSQVCSARFGHAQGVDGVHRASGQNK